MKQNHKQTAQDHATAKIMAMFHKSSQGFLPFIFPTFELKPSSGGHFRISDVILCFQSIYG